MKSCLFTKIDKTSQTISKCLNHSMTFYQGSDEFDLLTHGAGPGIVSCVVRHIIKFLNSQCCLKHAMQSKTLSFKDSRICRWIRQLHLWTAWGWRLHWHWIWWDGKKHIKGSSMWQVLNQVVTSTKECPTYGGDSDDDFQVIDMAKGKVLAGSWPHPSCKSICFTACKQPMSDNEDKIAQLTSENSEWWEESFC